MSMRTGSSYAASTGTNHTGRDANSGADSGFPHSSKAPQTNHYE